MTSRQMAELFQPFKTASDASAARAPGHRIGLVISQAACRAHGGRSGARSIAGQGSSIILALPRVLDPEPSPRCHGPLDLLPTEYHRRVVH
jgi:signal transduction histidine kinase